MKKLTFMFAMLFMAVVSFAQEAVTLPDNLFTEELTFEGTHKTSSVAHTPATVIVGIDGNDVYMQGLAYSHPEGWVKGTLDGNTVTFAANQYMGQSSDGDVYFNPTQDVTFTFNGDSMDPEYTCTGYEIKNSYMWEVYENVRLFMEKGMDVNELVAQMTITPDYEVAQTSLKTFTMTFPAAVTIDDAMLPTLNLVEGTINVDETGMVVTIEFPEVTEPGVYTLLIPFGAILYDGLPIMDFEYEYNVLAAPEFGWTINPAEGKVESLKNFTLTFQNGNVNFNKTGYTDPTLTKDGVAVFENGRIYAHNGGVQVYDVMFGSTISEDDAITEDGTYVLTIHAADFIHNGEAINGGEDLVFTYTIGEGSDEPGVEPGNDDFVTLPEGVTAEEYQYKAKKIGSSIINPDQEVTRTVQVAFDGNDVYVQGLSAEYAETWVKGVRDGANVTFTKEQLIDVTEEELLGTTLINKTVFNADADVVFAYDEANNKLTAEAYAINISYNDGDYASVENYTGVEIFKENSDEPIVEPGDDLVTPPATAEQKDYLFEANNKYNSSTAYNRAAKVAVDGTDVYFQGLSSQLPEAWVKGTMADGNVTVAGKQFLGTFVVDNTVYGGTKTETDIYFSPAGEAVVFAYNTDEDAYTTAAYGIDAIEEAFGKNEDYINVKIYTEKAETLEEVLAMKAIDPEEGEVESLQNFTITFGDAVVTVNEDAIPTIGDLDGGMAASEDGKTVMVDFDEPITEAGEYTLTIPAGAIMYNGEDMGEMTFAYTIVAPKVLSWTINPEEAENLESLSNHFALNFADGSVSRINYTQDLTLTFNGQTEMTQAAESEEDEDVNLLEFRSMSLNSNGTKADIYFGSMSDFTYTEEGTYVLTIPAGIFKNNASGEELAEMTFTWTITKKGGDTTAIEYVSAEESNAIYFDATGRRTDSNAKGLVIKQVRTADGVKTIKMARK